jgi:hypothetical protein
MRWFKPWITLKCLILLWCLSDVTPLFAQTIDFGQYHALLIANQNYRYWNQLDTPYNDVDELTTILEKKYGFKVEKLPDATRDQIIDKLEWYRKHLTARDNLLIYYAGHGKLRKDGGYWIGVDAQKQSRSRWLHYRVISDLIDAENEMKARHVLVIADSCYAGSVLRQDEGAFAKRSPDETDQAWFAKMSKSPSRTALTSGGTEPVIDHVGRAEKSIFAQELISRLKNNAGVLDTVSLYDLIKKDVHARARRIVGNDAQAPEYDFIPGTGHRGGDFLFVPKGRVVYVPQPEMDTKTDFGIKGDGIRTAAPTSWNRIFGGSLHHEEAGAAVATPDGGYIIAGRGRSNDLYIGDLWITKLNPAGEVEWEQFHQHSGQGMPNDVQVTPEGGYVVAGYYRASKQADADGWVVKLNSGGRMQWSRVYGGKNSGFLKSILVDKGGGYIVAGSLWSKGQSDAWVLRLNAQGEIEWERLYGGTEEDSAESIQTASDDGYVLAGNTQSLGKRFAWIFKISPHGAKQWEKTYEGPVGSGANSLLLTRDGGYAVVGQAVLDSEGVAGLYMSDVFLLKLNYRGSLEWKRTYSRSWSDKGIDIAELSDGNYVVAGETSESKGIHTKPWIFKIDKLGELQWERFFKTRDTIRSLGATLDGGLIVAGGHWRTGNDKDSWIAKLDTSGNSSR